MIHLILVEDQDQQAKKIGELCQGILNELPEETWTWRHYSTAEAVLAEEECFDIALVDIALGDGIDGIELVRRLRKENCTASIVFLTNCSSSAAKGYGLGVLAFVEKEEMRKTLKEVLPRCFQDVKRRRRILTFHGLEPLLADEILCIQIEDKYITICVEDRRGKEANLQDIEADSTQFNFKDGDKRPILSHVIKKKSIRLSMREAEEMLESYGFYRCHHSWMVNIRKVSSWKAGFINLSWKKSRIPLSRTYLASFKKAYNRMLLEELEANL